MQKVLITSGGTEEPIDGVRTISNFSTGRTGAVISEIFHKKGFDVTLLKATRAVTPESGVRVLTYGSFSDLNTLLIEELKTGDYMAVIHLAAVSDYSVDYLLSGESRVNVDDSSKLDSSKPLSIVLKPNFKILHRLKEYALDDIQVIGFKLTKNAPDDLIKSKVEKIFNSGDVDFVVQNDLSSINRQEHITNIYNKDGLLVTNRTKEALALTLIEIIRSTGGER